MTSSHPGGRFEIIISPVQESNDDQILTLHEHMQPVALVNRRLIVVHKLRIERKLNLTGHALKGSDVTREPLRKELFLRHLTACGHILELASVTSESTIKASRLARSQRQCLKPITSESESASHRPCRDTRSKRDGRTLPSPCRVTQSIPYRVSSPSIAIRRSPPIGA